MATKLRQVDREALRRAVERQRQRGGESARQIEAELASEPWQDAAEFAAYSQQVANLHLKPWQIPPCWLCTANDLNGASDAARL